MAKRQDTRRAATAGRLSAHSLRHEDVLAVTESLLRLEEVARRLRSSESHRAPESTVDSVLVPIKLQLSEDRDTGSAPHRALEWLERVRREIRESVLAAAAFERGRMYCLRCENSICEHSLPPGPRSVFVGYGQTGRPEWSDFDQLLDRRGDARVDQLYGPKRGLLTCSMASEELYSPLLPGFEELQRRFLVLAQLCVGYFDRPGDGEPIALTVQIVRSLRGESSVMVALNVMGRTSPSPRATVEEQDFIGLQEALLPLRRELRALGANGRTIPGTGIALKRLTSRCQSLLRDACRDLEHRHRSDGRRTRHAQERSQRRGRPTAKAFEEAQRAPRDRVMTDRESDTVVVIGPHNRVHVFTKAGKHVTSIVYESSQIRSRQSRKRWVPIDDQLHEVFRRNLQGRMEDHG